MLWKFYALYVETPNVGEKLLAPAPVRWPPRFARLEEVLQVWELVKDGCLEARRKSDTAAPVLGWPWYFRFV